MDWLLGKKASTPSSPSPSQAPPPPPQQPDSSVFQQQAYEAPSIDSLLRPHDPAALHPLANLDKDTLDYIILEDEQIKSAGALPSRGWTDDLCYGTGTTYLAALGLGGIWGVFEALSKQRIASQVHATLNPAVETATLGGQLNASAAAAASAASSASGAHSQAARQSGKLLLNNILNHVTRRGPFLGNSAGVLAMSYNLIDAYLSLLLYSTGILTK